MSISLPCIGRARVFFFSSCFCLHPGCRKGLEDKTYLVMDSSVHGESDGVNCILVDDYIRKLGSLYLV